MKNLLLIISLCLSNLVLAQRNNIKDSMSLIIEGGINYYDEFYGKVGLLIPTKKSPNLKSILSINFSATPLRVYTNPYKYIYNKKDTIMMLNKEKWKRFYLSLGFGRQIKIYNYKNFNLHLGYNAQIGYFSESFYTDFIVDSFPNSKKGSYTFNNYHVYESGVRYTMDPTLLAQLDFNQFFSVGLGGFLGLSIDMSKIRTDHISGQFSKNNPFDYPLSGIKTYNNKNESSTQNSINFSYGNFISRKGAFLRLIMKI